LFQKVVSNTDFVLGELSSRSRRDSGS